jgi:hypothetical protein
MLYTLALTMFRIKKSAIVRSLQEGTQHTFTVYEYPDGYVLTLDDKALLETERGEVREFKKLDAAASLLRELGIEKFSVVLKPCNGQPKPAK